MAARARKPDESFEDYRESLRKMERLSRIHKQGQYISINGHPVKEPIPVASLRRHRL